MSILVKYREVIPILHSCIYNDSMRYTLIPARLSLVFVGVLTYVASLQGVFHFDDSHTIENNSAIRSLKNIPHLWTDTTTSSVLPENRTYRPLYFTFVALAWAMGDGAVWPFHLLKIFLHVAIGLLIFLLWKKLLSVPKWLPTELEIIREEIPLFLAMIFLVHPALSESVLYISAMSTQLAAFFYLVSIALYLKYIKTESHSQKKLFLIGSLCAYFLSVMAKEEGITLPAVIALMFIFPKIGKMKDVLIYAAVGLIAGAILYYFHPEEGWRSRTSVNAFEYFITQWRAYIYYIKLLVWPFNLNADNVSFQFSKSLMDLKIIQAVLMNLALFVSAWFFRKTLSVYTFGVIWFFITISPASSIIPLAEPVNEHRTYLASIGMMGALCMMVLYIGSKLFDVKLNKQKLFISAGSIMMALLIGTQFRIQTWATSESLWSDTLEKNPTSGRAANNLALVYMKRAQFVQALELLDRCEKSWDRYTVCPINKGISFSAIGKLKEAEASFKKALHLDPNHVHAHYYFGKFLFEKKHDLPQALVYLKKAEELSSGAHTEAKQLRLEIENALAAQTK